MKIYHVFGYPVASYTGTRTCYYPTMREARATGDEWARRDGYVVNYEELDVESNSKDICLWLNRAASVVQTAWAKSSSETDTTAIYHVVSDSADQGDRWTPTKTSALEIARKWVSLGLHVNVYQQLVRTPRIMRRDLCKQDLCAFANDGFKNNEGRTLIWPGEPEERP